MFEIFMFWVWVTILSVAAVWPFYALGCVGLLAWVSFILRKANYTEAEAESISNKLRSILNTPANVLNFRPGDLNGGIRAIFLSLGVIYICVSTIEFLVKLDDESGSWAMGMIDVIAAMSSVLAGITYGIAPTVLIVVGGSWLFIKLAKVWRKINAKLDKLNISKSE